MATLAAKKAELKTHGAFLTNTHAIARELHKLGGSHMGFTVKAEYTDEEENDLSYTLHGVKLGGMDYSDNVHFWLNTSIDELSATHYSHIPITIWERADEFLRRLHFVAKNAPAAFELFKESEYDDLHDKLYCEVTETIRPMIAEYNSPDNQDGIYNEYRLTYNPLTNRVSQSKGNRCRSSYLVALNID